MRKAVKKHLERTLQAALSARYPTVVRVDSGDRPVDLCFCFATRNSMSFFLHVICSDDSDSFRPYVAWSDGISFPDALQALDLKEPISVAVEMLLSAPAAQIPLAAVAPGAVAWNWHLDPEYGRWRATLEALMAAAESGRLDEEAYATHLTALPKKCSVEEAKATATQMARKVARTLEQHGQRIIVQVAERREP